ncbi:hypothetical protein [Pseudoneobacillus rhizosphaerae]|jgi:hypothetical protein|nr:hypothetical protein [Pseudoneobacillus rhizosphaerae]
MKPIKGLILMQLNYFIEFDATDEWKKFRFPKQFGLIEYLLEDMEGFSEPIYLPYFQRVIDGVSERERIGGNMCWLEINKDTTLIEMEFIPDDVPNNQYFLTNDLIKIIRHWQVENKDKLL